jgi:saccharopine dehydrogenase-like NADP-dependent oxidoreductase
MRYAVLGGAGSMGRIIVRDLSEFSESGDEVLIADYDVAAAQKFAETLPKKAARVFVARVDVHDAELARKALAGSFVLINAVQYQLNVKVMELALSVGAHYIDLGGLFHVTREQLELHAAFEQAGRLGLVGMGAAPGITNLLARMGCEKLDRVAEIHTRVAGIDLTKYASTPALPISYSLQTILEEMSLKPAVFTKGKFQFVEPMSGETPNRFPPPIGTAHPMFTLHSEVATLPLSFAKQGVREVSFKIAFDREFIDRVRFLRDFGMASHEPLRVGGVEVKPIEVANKVAMAQPKPVPKGKVKAHEVVRAVVKGTKGKTKQTWVLDCHTEGISRWGIGTDVNTGCPPAIAARLLAKGAISEVGVLPPERAVPLDTFFGQLKKRGMWVTASRKSGWAFGV